VETRFRYIKDGFEGILYKAQREDDRLLIVVQGLKGLDLPCRYAEFLPGGERDPCGQDKRGSNMASSILIQRPGAIIWGTFP